MFTNLNEYKNNFYFDDIFVCLNCQLLCFTWLHQTCEFILAETEILFDVRVETDGSRQVDECETKDQSTAKIWVSSNFWQTKVSWRWLNNTPTCLQKYGRKV